MMPWVSKLRRSFLIKGGIGVGLLLGFFAFAVVPSLVQTRRVADEVDRLNAENDQIEDIIFGASHSGEVLNEIDHQRIIQRPERR